MRDKNSVYLEGIIGDDFKYAKSESGYEYATFSLCINNFLTKMVDDKDLRTAAQTFVRIFVRKRNLVQYLHDVNAHRGQRASVFGMLSSFKNEYRGIEYVALNVLCLDIGILKTRSIAKVEGTEIKADSADEAGDKS